MYNYRVNIIINELVKYILQTHLESVGKVHGFSDKIYYIHITVYFGKFVLKLYGIFYRKNIAERISTVA